MDTLQNVNRNIIAAIISCYHDNDQGTLDRFAISHELAQKLASLPNNVRHRLENQRIPFIDFKLNESAVNSAISSCYANGQRDEMYNKAILLGAAKSTMRKLCNMSSAEFAVRRKALNITETRVRPQSLSADEELKLNECYLDHADQEGLATLIALAEETGIEINRIYTYYTLQLVHKK